MTMMDFRESGESWLDALIRLSEEYGLEEDVEASFYAFLRDGMDEPDAAYSALYDWDIPVENNTREEDSEE